MPNEGSEAAAHPRRTQSVKMPGCDAERRNRNIPGDAGRPTRRLKPDASYG
ncbi:hypothetical protein JCM17961_07740 [Endothiovibrio diazotrophicus]